MCGRFTQSQSVATLAQAFGVDSVPSLEARYNIAPTQKVLAVLRTADQPGRRIEQLRWGLIPSWAKDPAIGSRMINARAETVAEKPSFRAAFKQRRCLIAADGFYEWQRRGRTKQPYYFCLTEHEPFAFAGLWETWQDPAGETIHSCTLITTVANKIVAPVHDRMPVMLLPEAYEVWLDPSVKEPETLQPLLSPYPTAAMQSYPVGLQVNNPSHDRPDCIQPLAQDGSSGETSVE